MKTKMTRIFTLSALIGLFFAYTEASATTYTFTNASNNSSPSYHLNTGDSLSIASGNTPSLHWSSDPDAGSSFHVQRSYDGTHFTTIKTVASDINKTVYAYNDQQVTQSATVYYPIKAIEPDGNQKYSDTRSVKFSNSNGMTIQTVPNPFTSQFTIHYQGIERTSISIKVYSLNGQLQLTKNVLSPLAITVSVYRKLLPL